MSSPAHQPNHPPVRPMSRLVQAFWRLTLFCGGLLLVTPCTVVADDAVSREYQIKAAFLYNFAKFVVWPDRTFASDSAPLVIGVYGSNPFGDQIRAIAKDHKINGREIQFKSVNNATEAAGVHILFIDATEDSQVAEILAELKTAPVLTIGETDKFVAAGGIIHFVPADNKMRFEINASTAEEHGLKISAQLLKLARAVHQEPRPQP